MKTFKIPSPHLPTLNLLQLNCRLTWNRWYPTMVYPKDKPMLQYPHDYD